MQPRAAETQAELKRLGISLRFTEVESPYQSAALLTLRFSIAKQSVGFSTPWSAAVGGSAHWRSRRRKIMGDPTIDSW